MSGYIGNKRAVNFASVDLPIRSGSTEVISDNGSFSQKNSVPTAVTVDANTNTMFFGHIDFENTVTINGNLVVIGGNINFKGDVNVNGSLLYS